MLTVREQTMRLEESCLSERAALSSRTKGRRVQEDECPLRTPFQRDRDRIIHCKAFRRLKHKTQVFLAPEGDHYRTRLTHTLEVSQIARTIARALRLNEDLTEAIALAHDLGHTPFGHAGERALSNCFKDGFRHYDQSVRVVTLLENNPKGLNLTYEVIDGIQNHTIGTQPCTLEGQVVRAADKIAYLNHDIDDAITGSIISEKDIPKEITCMLGTSKSERINSLVMSIVTGSGSSIQMDENTLSAFLALNEFMFKSVYLNPVAKGEEGKSEGLIRQLYYYFCEYPGKMPEEYKNNASVYGVERSVVDYIAGMTDRYALRMYEDLFIPKSWWK